MSTIRLPSRSRRWPLVVIGAVVVAIVLFTALSGFVIDLLWYREIDQSGVLASIGNGINVLQSDLESGLAGFDDQSFDSVVLSQTLQAVRHTEEIVLEMLRVGREAIVTFPNFGHWSHRLQVLAGRMPVSKRLPYEWYNTPNIHLCTVADFDAFCAEPDRLVERLQGLGVLAPFPRGDPAGVDRLHPVGLGRPDEPGDDVLGPLVLPGFEQVAVDDHRVSGMFRGDFEPLLAALASSRVTKFESREPSLEEIFLGFYR